MVTDAASHEPLSGAEVKAGVKVVRTDADGKYSLTLSVGVYELSATKYGGYTVTSSTVDVGPDGVTQDFALTLAPKATIKGTVTDGSGHGWPLYAKVAASDGTVAFTDPATGLYQLSVPQDAEYTLTVSAVSNGYSAREEHVTVGTADVTRDSRLTVDLGCAAPGYQAKYSGTTQTFSAKSAPTGWTVSNVDPGLPGYAHQPGWVFTNPGRRGNHTGGTGNFAVVDSDRSGPAHLQDTRLASPTTDLTGSAAPASSSAVTWCRR